jgi:hypothetical protein
VPPRLKPALPGEYPMNDLLPQPNWPEGHAPKVPALIEALERRSEFVSVKLAWASGLMGMVRKPAAALTACGRSTVLSWPGTAYT